MKNGDLIRLTARCVPVIGGTTALWIEQGAIGMLKLIDRPDWERRKSYKKKRQKHVSLV